MKATNNDLAEFRNRKRNPSFAYPKPIEREPWSAQEDNHMYKAAAICFAAIVLVTCAIGFAMHMANDIRDDEFTRNVVNECKAQGRYPHVYRDGQQTVLGVRCDAFEESTNQGESK